MLYKIFFVCLYAFFLIASPVFAQDGYINDDSASEWDSDTWQIDSSVRQEDPDAPPPIEELDSNDELYLTEEEAFLLEQSQDEFRLPGEQGAQVRVDYQKALEKSSVQFNENIFYGIGTGLVIGGWLALFVGENSRDNFRYIGSGLVLGGLMGLAVASRAFYINPPTLAQAESPLPLLQRQRSLADLVATTTGGVGTGAVRQLFAEQSGSGQQLAINLNFKF